MYRKTFIILLFMVALVSIRAITYADGPVLKNTDKSIIQIINYNKITKTFEKSYVLCGRAKEGTTISMEQYWFKNKEEKSIVFRKNLFDISNNDGAWILQKSEEWIVGASGYFAKPITWIDGKNKITLKATNQNNEVEVIDIDVELINKYQFKQLFNSHIINSIGTQP